MTTVATRDYAAFLASKRPVVASAGVNIDPSEISPLLFPFQRDLVRWAVRKGRAAIFADTGLGKTFMQIEWARLTGRRTLILAPLVVSYQTAAMAKAKLGVEVTVCRDQSEVRDGINITNYDRLHLFDPAEFGAIVLDESSILKSFSGIVRKAITDFASGIPFRLCCTATPAPNDLVELTNHAEFLDVMSGKEIIALFFRTDGNTTHAWRLKHHAQQDFWRWVASWAAAIQKPSDLGYPDDGFVLPPMKVTQHQVESRALEGMLLPVEALTLQERQAARRDSISERVRLVAGMINGSDETWIVWCNLNSESHELAKAIPCSVEVEGADTSEFKEQALIDFSEGRTRVLITKPSIAGFGVNWQHCHNVAFVGLSDSYEQYYQAVRRCWRFGQDSTVNVHIVTAEAEGAVLANIERKSRQAEEMMAELTEHVAEMVRAEVTGSTVREIATYSEDEMITDRWTLKHGDCIERIREVPSESVGLTVFSPPFPGMYAYTNSPRDIGNTTGVEEMIEHFSYLIPELLRVTMPGRICCIHLSQLTAMKSREGYIGLKDYRGETIKAMEAGGWFYAGEVTIDKNPQVQATRNKERGLLFKSLATDSSMMRMALADYLLYFRKPGENPEPIQAGQSKRYNEGAGWITEQEWIEWAAPVWYRAHAGLPGGIRETDVLNTYEAKEVDDERHIAPLQLGVIERAVKLWSAPGDVVFSPFAGIGSEGYVAVKHGRRFVGIELKRSYFDAACKNLARAEENVTRRLL